MVNVVNTYARAISEASMKASVDIGLRGILFTFFFTLFFLAFYAPLVQHINGFPAGENIYTFFSPICHQYPTRCFWFLDRPWALCARCSSIYLGLALSALITIRRYSFLWRFSFGLLLLMIAAVDPVLQLLGFYESTNLLRFFTGIIGGSGAFMLIYPFPITSMEHTV